ncbi:hypothetical protein WKI25_09060 [Acinetobacter baumannii]|uniref:hypothetical protein n=1 Tax=Acinetobacter baumannii TaxID=470 RepID=UPI0013903773|nr:hypothetical protein [Acinetobacter baumannii]ELB1534324.1 hypothetical protein [Acinetobacter baumannii]
MKQKYSIVFTMILIFLLCLGISVLFKKIFDIDGDYLSAFATLVAAIVAVRLYTDWREQLNISLLISSKENLNKLFNELLYTHDEMLRFLSLSKKSNEAADKWPEYHIIYKKFIICFEETYAELENNRLLLSKFINRNGLSENFYYPIDEAHNYLVFVLDSFNIITTQQLSAKFFESFYNLLKNNNFEIEGTIAEHKVEVRKNCESILNILLNKV